MPRGAGVVRYEGKRGVVWRIKFVDAAGRHVQETVGRAADGVTRRRAEEALADRLSDVRRYGLRHETPDDRPSQAEPADSTFEHFAERWITDYLPGRNLKRSTTIAYEGDLRRHLIPALGTYTLRELEIDGPKLVDTYIAEKIAGGLAPKTVRNHVVLLGLVLERAVRWNEMTVNPVARVEKPRVEQPEMQILTDVEIARLLTAYRQLEQAAGQAARPWWALTRRVVTFALGTGMRRGEILAVRWGDVELVQGLVRIERQFVRAEMTTPKSRTSRRTIQVGPRVRQTLEEEWKASVYRSDGDLVFGHPQLGTPLDPSKLSREYMRPALAKAKITKPIRPWHDLRHTALTHDAAAGNPQAYVQMRAGHSQGTITERYVHASQVLWPGAAERTEERLFAALGKNA